MKGEKTKHAIILVSTLSTLVFFGLIASYGAAEEMNVLSVSFDKVNEKNRAVFTITNTSGRDIDDIRFGFKLLNAQGKSEVYTAYTDKTPGIVYLKTGDSKKFYLYPSTRRKVLFEKLVIDPDAFKPVIEVEDVTYF